MEINLPKKRADKFLVVQEWIHFLARSNPGNADSYLSSGPGKWLVSIWFASNCTFEGSGYQLGASPEHRKGKLKAIVLVTCKCVSVWLSRCGVNSLSALGYLYLLKRSIFTYVTQKRCLAIQPPTQKLSMQRMGTADIRIRLIFHVDKTVTGTQNISTQGLGSFGPV